MPIFLSKHQKLILQCYPPGKGFDKVPNPSELSYLLYYASTRRVKLEKVIKFLNKKTIGDANRNRVGNLQVTLAIVSSLIEKCTDNLNVFAPEVLSIIDLSIKNNDLGLTKVLLRTFASLCKNLNPDLFVGDKVFVDKFIQVSKKIFDFGIGNLLRSQPNKLEWTMVSLFSAKYVSYCVGYNSKLCLTFLSDCIPFLIESLYTNQTSPNLLGDDSKLGKVVLAKSTVVHYDVADDFENNVVVQQDLYDVSLEALKSCFNTSYSSQISEAIIQVVKFSFNQDKSSVIADKKWLTDLLQLCTSWVPVQLRFVVLGKLLSDLRASSEDKQQIQYQKHIGKCIIGLVASNVNLIGLSISDVMQVILDLKDHLYFEQQTYLSADDIDELSNIYSAIIIKLSTHIYYSDQVPDSVNEIFIKIDSTLQVHLKKLQNPNVGNESLFKFILSLLADVRRIFQDLKNDSAISRNHVDIKHWEVGLPLIAQKESTNLYNELSITQVEQIQLSYLQLFKVFIDNELIKVNRTKESGPGATLDTPENIPDSTPSLNGVSTDRESSLSPDYSNLISIQPNFISHYLVYIDKYFTNNDHLNLQVMEYLLDITKKIIDHFGINFFHNFLPFYFHWSGDNNGKLIDTFAHTVLQYILNGLDNQYKSELLTYSNTSELLIKLNETISYKVHNGLWADDLVHIKNQLSSPKELPIITKQDIQTYVSGNRFLASAIVVDKPLILTAFTNGTLKQLSEGNGHAGIHEHPANGNEANGHKQTQNGESNGLKANKSISSLTNSSNEDFKPGLGLGNTADITSIRSGLRNISGNYNTITSNLTSNGNMNNTSFNTTNSFSWTENNGSLLTADNKHFKVSDLKEILSDFKPDEANNQSILSKQMTSQDVRYIIEDLDDDDSESYVV